MQLKTMVLAAAVAAGVAACGGGSLVQDGVPTGTLTIQNNTNENLGVITISQCSASSHGGNQMGFGNWIEPGDSYDWEVSKGCYDVQAGSAAGAFGDDPSYSAATTRLNIVAGQTTRFTVN